MITSRTTELENYLEEPLWIEIKHKGESILLGTIYRRPNTPVSFWDRLNIVIEKASEISKNIIIVDDLNEDLLDVRNHHFRAVLALNSLNNVISVQIRRKPTSDTLLDPVAVNDSNGIIEAGTIDLCNRFLITQQLTYMFLLFTILETLTNVLFGFIIEAISIS